MKIYLNNKIEKKYILNLDNKERSLELFSEKKRAQLPFKVLKESKRSEFFFEKLNQGLNKNLQINKK